MLTPLQVTNTPDHQLLWQKAMEVILDNISPQHKVWFDSVHSVGFEPAADGKPGSLTLWVPSPFFVEKFEETFSNLLRAVIARIYGKGTQLFYQYNQIQDDPQSKIRMRSDESSKMLGRATAIAANPFAAVTLRDFDPQLNPSYTFENFIPGQANKIARVIGEKIGNDPKCKTFNPLFVFGSTGVGKTHLIQAIGIRTKETNPNARVLYVTARLFESWYTAAANGYASPSSKIVNGKPISRINEFFEFFQSIDTLIVDDVQDLAGANKAKTQNTLFHIFNHLHQNGRQIILSSDVAPSLMVGFEDRMLSRFKWGMSVQLDKPDLDLRRRVLRRKAEKDGIELSDQVVDYICENITDSIRDLEGVMVSLVTHAAVLNKSITLDLARMVISNAVQMDNKTINFETIAQSVCNYYDISQDLLFSSTRKREVSDARQIVMYLAKKHAGLSYKGIGNRLSRNHATVIYACDTIANRCETDKTLRHDIECIESTIL